MEQYQKFSSDEIGSPRVDLQGTIASPPPILPPVFARSMTPPTDNSPPRRHLVASPLLAASTGSLPPLPRRHRLRIGPQPFLRLSRFLLQPFKHRIPRRILPIPPAPAVFDQRVIDVGAIRQEHIGKGAPVLVEAVRLERDFFPKGELRGGVLGSLP